MSLFPIPSKESLSPASHSESEFSFYSRSTRPDSTVIRELLESWFLHYPETFQPELRTRFKSEFLSAFFELMLHEMLLRHKFRVDIHPTLPGTNKRPDFLATAGESSFLIEATTAMNFSDAEKKLAAIKTTIYDQINSVESPNFFLRLKTVEVKPGSSPSTKKIKAFLADTLPTLDVDELRKCVEEQRIDDLPTWSLDGEDYHLEVQPLPKPKHLRNRKGDRTIGMYPSTTFIDVSHDSIREVIHRKATRYGQPETPYILAINCVSADFDDDSILDALFGSEKISYDPNTGAVVNHFRARDGSFFGPEGFENTRVSGVLIGRVFPSNLGSADLTLYHHPGATRPLDNSILEVNHIQVLDHQLVKTRTASLRQVFGLDKNWPQ